MKKYQIALLKSVLLLLPIIIAISWINGNVPENTLRLEKILELLQMDHDLLWVQRPGMDIAFEKTTVVTDDDGFRIDKHEKRPDKPSTNIQETSGAPLRIETFGASPTFGYGVEYEDTYPLVTGQLLREMGFNIIIRNRGQIGYSSWQGLRLLERSVKQVKPDIVTISYMVNDIDRLRFFFSNGKPDSDIDLPSRFRVSFYNRSRRFPPTDLLFRFRNRLISTVAGKKICSKIYDLSSVRVPPEDYRNNLIRIHSICSREKIATVFITMPFRLPEPVPTIKPATMNLVREADSLLALDMPEEALSSVEKALHFNPEWSKALYIKGLIEQKKGNKTEAEKLFCRAVHNIIYDCARNAPEYNTIMKAVASETGSPLVDAASLLGSDKADMNLFVKGDYIHPNSAGHEIIAGKLADVIGGMLPLNRKSSP